MSSRIAGWSLIVVLALSARAAAQDARFAARGQTLLGVERILGLTWTHTKTSRSGSSESESVVSFTRVTAPVSALLSTYSYPRVAVDYFFVDGVSVGTGFAYAETSGSTSDESSSSASSSSALATFHTLLFAPRFGYAHAFNHVLALWPRAGATYVRAWRSDHGGSATLDQLALTLDVTLLIRPFPHVAVCVGPSLDLGVAGSSSNGSSEVTTKTTEIGLQTGLLVHF